MRKLSAAVVVVLVAMALGWRDTSTAQLAPSSSGPTGEALAAKAKAVLQALQSLSPEALFEQLAPWRRNECELASLRVQRRLREGNLQWARLDRIVNGPEGLDPAKKLNLASAEDYAALTPARMFALHFGLYRLAADKAALAQLNDQWLEVDRRIGLGGGAQRSMERRFDLITSVGAVAFENIGGETLFVACTSDGHSWDAVDVFAKFSTPLDIEMTLAKMQQHHVASAGGGLAVAASEADGQLGSMKGQARVAYAKKGQPPKTLTGAVHEGGCGAGKSELSTKSHTIRDTVYGDEVAGGVVAEPDSPDGLYVLHVFRWAGGIGKFYYFATKEDLDAKIEEGGKVGWETLLPAEKSK